MTSRKRAFWAGVALLDLVLAGFVGVAGERALRTGEYAFEVQRRPKRNSLVKVLRYEFEGAEARRVGAGLLALAVVPLAWAVALAGPGLAGWGPLQRRASAAALALLLLGAMILLPPWRLGRPPVAAFYAGLAVLALLRGGMKALKLERYAPGVYFMAVLLFPLAAAGLPEEAGLALIGSLFFGGLLALQASCARARPGSLPRRLFA